jgi:hypothetical protein
MAKWRTKVDLARLFASPSDDAEANSIYAFFWYLPYIVYSRV